MRVSIELSEPFKRMEEGKSFRPSIVAYGKFPYVVRDRDGQVVSHQHRVYINLWIIELAFDWITTDET